VTGTANPADLAALGGRHHFSRAEPRAYPRRSRAFAKMKASARNLANGEVAGGIGTKTIDWLNRKVEIGYWLAPPYRVAAS